MESHLDSLVSQFNPVWVYLRALLLETWPSPTVMTLFLLWWKQLYSVWVLKLRLIALQYHLTLGLYQISSVQVSVTSDLCDNHSFSLLLNCPKISWKNLIKSWKMQSLIRKVLVENIPYSEAKKWPLQAERNCLKSVLQENMLQVLLNERKWLKNFLQLTFITIESHSRGFSDLPQKYAKEPMELKLFLTEPSGCWICGGEVVKKSIFRCCIRSPIGAAPRWQTDFRSIILQILIWDKNFRGAGGFKRAPKNVLQQVYLTTDMKKHSLKVHIGARSDEQRNIRSYLMCLIQKEKYLRRPFTIFRIFSLPFRLYAQF